MRFKSLKTFIFNMIEPTKQIKWYAWIYHILMTLVVIGSSAIVVVDLALPADSAVHTLLQTIEKYAVIIFGVEYLLKMFISELLFPGEGRWKSLFSYITSFDSFIDIICIASIFLNEIPTQFALIRMVKLIKLVRLVKLFDLTKMKETEEKGHKFKYRIYEIISKDREGDILSKIYDVLSVVLIILSVALLVMDTFTLPNVNADTIYHQVLYISEISITICFIIDYVLRVWTAEFEYPNVSPDKAKMKYIFSFLAIVDLLSIFAVFLVGIPRSAGVIKIFKLLRIVRVLKFSRYFKGIHDFGVAIKEKAKQIIVSIIILCLMVILFSILLYGFESGYEDTYFVHGFSGIQYCFVMLSGIGQTEIVVQSTGGQIMVSLMVISGGCIVGVPLAIISGEFTKLVKHLGDEKDDEFMPFEKVIKNLTPEEKEEILCKYLPKVKDRLNPVDEIGSTGEID